MPLDFETVCLINRWEKVRKFMKRLEAGRPKTEATANCDCPLNTNEAASV